MNQKAHCHYHCKCFEGLKYCKNFSWYHVFWCLNNYKMKIMYPKYWKRSDIRCQNLFVVFNLRSYPSTFYRPLYSNYHHLDKSLLMFFEHTFSSPPWCPSSYKWGCLRLRHHCNTQPFEPWCTFFFLSFRRSLGRLPFYIGYFQNYLHLHNILAVSVLCILFSLPCHL